MIMTDCVKEKMKRLTVLFCETTDQNGKVLDREFMLPQFSGDVEHQRAMSNKLGKLEDIEEKLGISLETLFKATTDSLYIKAEGDIIFVKAEDNMAICPLEKEISVTCYRRTYFFAFSDYGKTWALTKEELEK